MKPILLATAFSMLFFMGEAFSAERSVTLMVDGMDCPTCPYMIKRSLTRVDGVIDVSVSYDEKKADVTFDDERANVDLLMAATAEIGFPSRLAE